MYRLDIRQWFARGIAGAALCALGLAAAAEPAPKFDPAPWLDDFSALKAGMEDRYANLAWFASPAGGIDLPALERQTRKALAAADSDREARRIILDFVAAPGDGHFAPQPDDPPAGAAHAEPAAIKLNPEDPVNGCAALGYAPKGRIGFSLPFESLPGFQLQADGLAKGFRAGILPVRPGVQLGIVRISEFREAGTIWACMEGWLALAKAHKPIDKQSVEGAAQDQWFRAMSATLHGFTAAKVAAVVVDVGGNGGGDDLADWLPRLFTGRPVHSARMFVARSPAVAGYMDEELDGLRKKLPAQADAAAQQAMDRAIAGFEAEKAALSVHACDMSWVWREQRSWQPDAPCSRLTDVGSAAGSLDYLAPHTFATDIAKRFYWAAVADDYIGAWSGPVYVVTDDHSYSAAELFASSMQFNHIAKAVGQRTGGAGCGFVTDIPPLVLPHSRMAFRLPNCTRLRADGSDEVAGVQPDLPVLPLKDESPRARAARAAEVIAGDLAAH
jgi:hypothetical protein